MFFKLLFLFTVIPVAELYILIKAGGEIGAFNTILIILFTALFGAYLSKQQGFIVFRKISNALKEGRIPGRELLDGLFIFVGGFALLTPGFITDIIGITMLLPLTRNLYINYAKKVIKNKIQTGDWKINPF